MRPGINGSRSVPPLVSVLLPVYNCSRYLGCAVDSVLKQTLGDWEIVAVDDASIDGSYEHLKAWAQRDSRVRLHRNDRNLGMAPNWNRCLVLARGEYVVKLDADDAFEPKALETLYLAAKRSGVVGAGVRSVPCSQETLEPIGEHPADDAMRRAAIDPLSDQDRPTDEWLAISVFGHQLWTSCAVMTPLGWLRTEGYDERFGYAADTETLLRLLLQPGPFAHRGYVGVRYRQVAGSASDSVRRGMRPRWEGLIAHLRAIQRLRSKRQVRWGIRLQAVNLWRLLAPLRRGPTSRLGLRADQREALLWALGEVPRPPISDKLAWFAYRVLGFWRRQGTDRRDHGAAASSRATSSQNARS